MNHLPISAYSGLLKFDMKVFVNVAKLDLLKARGCGIRVLWTHFQFNFFLRIHHFG